MLKTVKRVIHGRKWPPLAMIAIMAALTLVSVPVVLADEPLPNCNGLGCNDPSDCGSKCFCNNPHDTVGTCFVDQ